ncbi:hypothetical protein C0991_000774 [Blastosporella zonata]|nr:hypothetical protein C0991_000774 [Blastosporella zonata]
MESKIKCDRQYPCSKCTARGKECIFNGSGRRTSAASHTDVVQQKPVSAATYTDSSSESSTSPTIFVKTPKAKSTYDASTFPIGEYPEILNEEPPPLFDPLGSSESLNSNVSTSFSKTDQFALNEFPASASAVGLYSLNTNTTSNNPNDSGRVVPVNSHLPSDYARDVFEPLFNNLFNPSPSMPLSEDFSWAGMDVFPFVSQASLVAAVYDDGESFDNTKELPTFDATPTLMGDLRQSSMNDANPPEPELQHYFHATTFTSDHKPPVLLGAMQACGALFVKTRKASLFINKTLAFAREALVQEFVSLFAVSSSNFLKPSSGEKSNGLL